MDYFGYKRIFRDPHWAALAAVLLANCTRIDPSFLAKSTVDSGQSTARGRSARQLEHQQNTRPVDAKQSVPTTSEIAPAPCLRLVVELPEIATGPDDPPPLEITDVDRLAGFFDRAARVLRKKSEGHVRIAIYGDSNHTMDFISGRLRRVLQTKYGDAGHGFVAVGKPWSHYRHMDVVHGLQDTWESYATTTHPLLDHRYGLSGICAASLQAGARAWVGTAPETAPIGKSASRFELFYLRAPGAGRFELRVDGQARGPIDARSDAADLGHEVVSMPDGPHRVEMVALDRHAVRMLGTVLERDGEPSFIVDSFGVGALNSRAHAREDSEINHAMLVRRHYDLIVFMTGANDVFTLDETPTHLRKLIALQRSALPNASILMVTPPDRGEKETFAPTVRAVEQRIAIAKETEVALWDLFQAMGGRSSMKRMKRRGLAISDFTHFNAAGGAWVGDRLGHALMSALAAHAARNPRLGCDPK